LINLLGGGARSRRLTDLFASVAAVAERCSSLERLHEPDEPSRQYFPLSNDAPGLRNAGHGEGGEGRWGGEGSFIGRFIGSSRPFSLSSSASPRGRLRRETGLTNDGDE